MTHLGLQRTMIPGSQVSALTNGVIPRKGQGYPLNPWVSTTMPSQPYYNLAYGNNVWAAVSSPTAVSASSPDGITWTQRTMPTTEYSTGLAFGAGVFTTVTYNNSGIGAYSTNAITWTQTTLAVGTNWFAVTYGDKFVAVARSSSIAGTSTNGITWTQRTLPTTAGWTDVNYGNGIYIAVPNANSYVARSTDGITWANQTTPQSGYYSVVWGNGVWVITRSSTDYATSTDGITWTARVAPAPLGDVDFGNGYFMAVISATFKSYYSTDGVNWTEKLLTTLDSWNRVFYGNNTWVVSSGASTGVANYMLTS